jgi:RHS repeat-associated protein
MSARIMKIVLWLLFAVAASAQAQTVEYLHTDALGSVVAVTNASRTVLERREYEPYGAQLTPAVTNGPGYTGHVQDAATGLVYMQQRYYDAQIGRFLSVDPVAARDKGDNFNRYGYAFNNPYRFTDPTGREGSGCWNNGSGCGGGRSLGTGITPEGIGAAADFTPFVGDIKGGVEAFQDPTPVNLIAAVVGVIPGPAGDVAAKVIKRADDVISMDKAVELGADHVNNVGDMITTGKGTNFQFTSSTVNEAGDTVTKNARFDVNPADPHVQKQGPHLNLETQVNGKTVSNSHTAIDPATVRPGDIPPPRPDLR